MKKFSFFVFHPNRQIQGITLYYHEPTLIDVIWPEFRRLTLLSLAFDHEGSQFFSEPNSSKDVTL